MKSVRNRGFSGPNAGNYGPGTLWIRILFTQCCPLFYGIALGQTLRKNAIRLSEVDQPLFTWDRSRKFYICQDHICNDSIIFASIVSFSVTGFVKGKEIFNIHSTYYFRWKLSTIQPDFSEYMNARALWKVIWQSYSYFIRTLLKNCKKISM